MRLASVVATLLGALALSIGADVCEAQVVPLPDTSVSGRVFGTELGFSGVTGVAVPLAGVTITLNGASEVVETTTDAYGNFRLEPVPAGRFSVGIDGRAATNPRPPDAYYPFFGRAWDGVVGRQTSVGDIFLPLIPAGTLQSVSQTAGAPVGLAESVLALFPELINASISLPTASAEMEPDGRIGVAFIPVGPGSGLLPPGLSTGYVLSVQTEGLGDFDAPIQLHLPNLEGLAPGAQTAIWSLNYATHQLEISAMGTVSEDGSYVAINSGFYIPAGGCHVARVGTQAQGGDLVAGGELPAGTVPNVGDETNKLNDSKVKCNIHLRSGEERFERTDLAVPGRGDISFRFERRYRSQTDYNGPLGFNWDFNYNEFLQAGSGGNIVRVYEGRPDTWVHVGGGQYTAPKGFFDTLIHEADGTYTLRSPQGFKRVFGPDGRLIRHVDRCGNMLVFDYDNRGNLDLVVDPFGREFNFTFQTFTVGGVEKDQLVSIVDYIGREVRYEYDSRGDLVSVRTPIITGTSTGNNFPQGRKERYVYSYGYAQPALNHNILQTFLPEEVATGHGAAFTWTYGTNPADSLTFDRVVSRVRGGTNAAGIAAGGTETLAYEIPVEPTMWGRLLGTSRRKTTYTDRKGNVSEHYFDDAGSEVLVRRFTRGLRAAEPDAYETHSYYDDDNNIIRKVFPEGNEVRLTYGTGSRAAKKNVVEMRLVAGPRGGGPDIVTTMVYEPLYNQLIASTDPRGNASGYVAPLGVTSVARYTSRSYLDYQEGTGSVAEALRFGIDLSGVPRGLGDLNGDGTVGQAFGNVVRATAPSVLLEAGSFEAARLGTTTQAIVTETRWNEHGQPLAIIDPEGNAMELTYYNENDPDGDGAVVTSAYVPVRAEASGYLRSTVADSALSTGRRRALASPTSLETTLTYNRAGNVTSVRNPRGVVTAFEVNALGEQVVVKRGADVSVAVASSQLLTGESALQLLERTRYDHNGRVTQRETENRGGTTPGVGAFIDRTFTYDIFDHVLSVTEEIDGSISAVTTFRYDAEENQTLVTKPEGNRVTTLFDERNLIFQVTSGEGTTYSATVQIDYDGNGNRIRGLDAEDNDGDGDPEATFVTYDGFDRAVETLDALGGRAVATYDIASNVVRAQMYGHPTGQPNATPVLLSDVRTSHDELNRAYRTDAALFLAAGFTTVRTPDLRDANSDGFVTTRVEFDALSRKTASIDDAGHAGEYKFDGAGRLIETLDAAGNRLERFHDRGSNVTFARVTDVSIDGLVPPRTFSMTYVYDQLDRLVRVTDAAGQTARMTYDAQGNVVLRSDGLGTLISDPLGLVAGDINGPGNTTSFSYDGLGRKISETRDLRIGGTGAGGIDSSNPFNADGQVRMTWTYDRSSRLTVFKDDAERATSYAYDALDRQIRTTYADGAVDGHTYDRDGNVVLTVDASGSVISTTHDALDRVTRIDVVRAAGVGGTTVETFEYDGLSRVTGSTDDNGDASGASTATTANVYDSLSRPIEDRQNGAAVSSTYTGNGDRVALTYAGGRRLDYTYDMLDRVRAIVDGATTIADARYAGPGMRLLRRTLANGTELSLLNAAGDEDAGYDAVHQVTRLRHLSGSSAIVDREYVHDRAGNTLSEIRREAQDLTDHYMYDSTYRLAATLYDRDGQMGAPVRDRAEVSYSYDGVGNRREVASSFTSTADVLDEYYVNSNNQYASIGTTTRTHDGNGNLTDDGRFIFTYDFRRRLVAVTSKATGAPVAKYRYDAANRRTQKTVYDPQNAGQVSKSTRFVYDGWRTVEEQSGSGATEVTYVYGGQGLDDLVEMRKTSAAPGGAGTYYYHQSAGLNVVAMTDSAGAVAARFDFEDFGLSAQAGALGNPLLFQGARLDEETGLYYFRSRVYDPVAGRFLQRDPVDDPVGAGSQYAFVGNGPISRVDPTGELANVAIGAGVGAFVGAGIETTVQLYMYGEIQDWGQVGTAAAKGAINGALFSGAGALMRGASLAARFMAYGMAGGLGGAASAAIDGRCYSWSEAGTDFATGGLIGVLGDAVGSLLKGVQSRLASGASVLNSMRSGGLQTGVPKLDALATSLPRFARILRSIEARGFSVRPDPRLSGVAAEITVERSSFAYNPNTMSVLDLRHELRHFQQLKHAGNPQKLAKSARASMEIDAYQFEQRVLSRWRSVDRHYLSFLRHMIDEYSGGGSYGG